MTSENQPQPMIVTCDAGGTMTDILLVDAAGRFSVGKASTTPQDESEGFWESLEDAFSQWGVNLDGGVNGWLKPLKVSIYTGTTMLNTLLQRRGKKVGLIITKGFEDSFVVERGFQAVAGYSYADRLHTVTHAKNPPLVPRRLVKGATERVDLFGKAVIPLYEHEVSDAVEELIEAGVDAIAILFLFSYINPAHEEAAAKIARKTMKKLRREVPVFLSSEVSPTIRELARLNSVVIQAYAAEPVREQLFRVEKRLQDAGVQYPLQTVLAYGGLASIRYPRLYESVVSGPVGGLLGARYLGEKVGINNLITTDMGGTSFDVGLVTEGNVPLVREPEFARFLLNLPMVTINSVGAGAGTYIRLDPMTKRILLGPESAGADPGPVCYDRGNEVPTVVDCDLILGVVNPDYYLGGKIKLNKQKCLARFREEIADPLGLDVYQAAEGVLELINAIMRDQLRSLVLAKGYSTVDYTVIAFGGAGPMHMAGFTEGLELKGLMTVPYAAAFSAFGCATVDYSHRYQRSTHMFVAPGAEAAAKVAVGKELNHAWEDLEKKALAEMTQEGFARDAVQLQQIAFVRYGGQLDDVEVFSPVVRIAGADDLDTLIARFEDLYARIYVSGARFPEAGFQILEVGVVATVPKVKPLIEKRELGSPSISSRALKGTRRVYHHGRWHEARILEMEELGPGNVIDGVAVIEAANTTLFVPERRRVRFDEWGLIWMEKA
jgi:acetone carboxylase, beta subunit